MNIEKKVNRLGITLGQFARISGISFSILKRLDKGFPRARTSTKIRIRKAIDELTLSGGSPKKKPGRKVHWKKALAKELAAARQ